MTTTTDQPAVSLAGFEPQLRMAVKKYRTAQHERIRAAQRSAADIHDDAAWQDWTLANKRCDEARARLIALALCLHDKLPTGDEP